MPGFLDGVISPEAYAKWLSRKAAAHVKRDRARDRACTGAAYREAIHAAVVRSVGKDEYPGEALDRHRVSTYANEASKAGRHAYKATLALLSVDHVSASSSQASFRICSWRTNDAKNDLGIKDFIALCESVLRHCGYRVEKA